jgi:hypothetical protein
MHAGIDTLRTARHHRMNFERNRGGCRERAVEDAHLALRETEAAINGNR